MVYFQLTSENYHWWWRAFFSSAASALFIFLYSVFYYITQLQINFYVGAMLYFGYMFVMSFTFALVTGSIGFLATFFFVRAIYGSIKIE